MELCTCRFCVGLVITHRFEMLEIWCHRHLSSVKAFLVQPILCTLQLFCERKTFLFVLCFRSAFLFKLFFFVCFCLMAYDLSVLATTVLTLKQLQYLVMSLVPECRVCVW